MRAIQTYRVHLLVLALLFSLANLSFVRQDGLEAVLNALKSGNVAAMGARMEDKIELTLPDQSGVVTKAQALSQLNKFFSANTAKGFELKHKGGAPGATYAIGTLKTQQDDFRVNIFLRGKGNKEMLRELRIQNMD
jgi:Domain of unknown function (DUF4783)